MAILKPTLGYPTQQEAILALYGQGLHPHDIAAQCKCSTNVVFKVIRDQPRTSKAHKAAKIDRAPEGRVWAADEGERRLAFHRRAVAGARAALEGKP